jgi:hypothetical protein
VWAAGKVQLGISFDFITQTGSLTLLDFTDATSTTWGGSTWGGATWSVDAGLISQLRRLSVQGTTFSTYLTNSILDQGWRVHRLDHHLRESRIPSVKSAP